MRSRKRTLTPEEVKQRLMETHDLGEQEAQQRADELADRRGGNP